MNIPYTLSDDVTPLPFRVVASEEEQFDRGTSGQANRGIPKQISNASSEANERSAAARRGAKGGDLDPQKRYAMPAARHSWETPRTVGLLLMLMPILRRRPPRGDHPSRGEWKLPQGCVLAVRYRSR
jgi:hypothetical protein